MTEKPKEQLVSQPLPATDPIIAVALWGLEDARARTRKVLAGLNPAAVDWQAHEGAHTIGTIMYHVALIELDWFAVEAMENQFPPDSEALIPHPDRDAEGKLTIVKGESLESLWSRLDKIRAFLLEGYRTMTLAEFRRARVLENYDVTPEWVLYHLMQHEAEHRGELSGLRQQAEKALNNG